MYCWIWFATILLRSFVSVFISDTGLLTSFFCLSGLVAGWWCLPLQFLGRVSEESMYYCCCSVTKSCPTLCDPMDYRTPGLPVLHHLLELAQTHVHWVGDAIQPFHPLSSPSPPAFNLSSIRVFSIESVLRIRWPKYWSFSFSICPSNEYSGLIFFRTDRFKSASQWRQIQSKF